jgi:cell division protein FtsB
MKSHILLIGLIIILTIYLFFGNKGLIKLNEMKKLKITYQQQLKDLREQNKKLEKEIILLRKDKAYLESVIRKELNMKKPNEDMYIIKK